MNTLRPRIKPIAWLALVAMLALVLMPTLARALNHVEGGHNHWAEVCTPQGMKRVAVDAATAADADRAPMQAAGHVEHCPYCSLAGQVLAPPPAPLPQPALARAAGYLAPLFLQAPHTLFAWRGPQSRAPPQIG